MTNHATGHAAEGAASDYLRQQGFEVIALNWRTRSCEIDIVARKKKVVYFTEVKYRKTAQQGGGLDYITPKKLAQMQYAAELWVAEHDYRGEYSLAAIEVAADPFQVTQFVTDLCL
jgi:uncharacterized protein (TIGR00252 family)